MTTHYAFEKASIDKSHSQWAAEAQQAEAAGSWRLAAHCWLQACNTSLSVRRSAEYLKRMNAASIKARKAGEA